MSSHVVLAILAALFQQVICESFEHQKNVTYLRYDDSSQALKRLNWVDADEMFVQSENSQRRNCGLKESQCTKSEAITGHKYYIGDAVCSPNSNYFLGLTSFGDLCMCASSGSFWCAGISQSLNKNSFMIMQKSGNFVVYKRLYLPVWSTKTNRGGISTLIVTNKGQAIIEKKNGNILWETPARNEGSSIPPSPTPKTPTAPTPPTRPTPQNPTPPSPPLPTKTPTGYVTSPSFTTKGYYHGKDVCKKEIDGECPCYPEDDDWYCDDAWYPWRRKKENKQNDALYEPCQTSNFPKCGKDEKLCPMRKPRLDRFFNDDKDDMYYYIDYDCIQCVPKDENCSKCSPGLWCPGVGRCVGPDLERWCRRTFGPDGIG